jgi:uncharacterized phiE125 gp8 family phage protein
MPVVDATTLVLVTPPAEPVVTIDDVKNHTRIDEGRDDAAIERMIEAATNYAQRFTGRQFVSATYDIGCDGFPYSGCPWYLPRPPLVSVTSITYTDPQGDSQTLSSSVYTVDVSTLYGRLYEADNQFWPGTKDIRNSVVVRFVAGYGAASAVPDGIKHAVLMLVEHWYFNRGATSSSGNQQPVPMGVESLLWNERVYM